MPKVIAVEGVGNVEFPDDMDDAAIQYAIETDILKTNKSGPAARIEARRLNPAPNSMTQVAPPARLSAWDTFKSEASRAAAPLKHPWEAAKGFAQMFDPRPLLRVGTYEEGGFGAGIVDAVEGDWQARDAARQRLADRGARRLFMESPTSPQAGEDLRDIATYALPIAGPMLANIGRRMDSPDPVERAQGTGNLGAIALGPEAVRRAPQVAAAAKKAVRPARLYTGVDVPSDMMNNMLADGNPKLHAEALKNIDRRSYDPVDPRQPGARDPGLQNLDDIGVVASRREGARRTRAVLDRKHTEIQSELQGNPQYQSPVPQPLIHEALAKPILERIQAIKDGKMTGSIDGLLDQLRNHIDDFENFAQGDYRPAVVNEFKHQRYDSLKKYKTEGTATDPGLQSILQEQALGAMELVNRSTVDAATGVSPIAEMNAKYGGTRAALDGWEGMIANKKAGGAQPPSIISPQGQNIGTIAATPVKRSLTQKAGDMILRSPLSVTGRAKVMRLTAPEAPTTPLKGPIAPIPPPPPPAALPPSQRQITGGPLGGRPGGGPAQPQIGGPPTPLQLPAAFDELANSAGVRMRPGATFEQGTLGPIPRAGGYSVPRADIVGQKVPTALARRTPSTVDVDPTMGPALSSAFPGWTPEPVPPVRLLPDRAASNPPITVTPGGTAITPDAYPGTAAFEAGREGIRSGVTPPTAAGLARGVPTEPLPSRDVLKQRLRRANAADRTTETTTTTTTTPSDVQALLDAAGDAQAAANRPTPRLQTDADVVAAAQRARAAKPTPEPRLPKFEDDPIGAIVDKNGKLHKVPNGLNHSELATMLEERGLIDDSHSPATSDGWVYDDRFVSVNDAQASNGSLVESFQSKYGKTVQPPPPSTPDVSTFTDPNAPPLPRRESYNLDGTPRESFKVTATNPARTAPAPSAPTSARAALGVTNSKSAPTPRQLPKAAEPTPSAKIDYSKMSENDLVTQLQNATKVRDTGRKLSVGTRRMQEFENRVRQIEEALRAKQPKRISANRNGRKIEGLLARSFNTSRGKAMVVKADDGSERLVFEHEVT